MSQLLDAILAQQHHIVETTTEDGARRMTAAVFLLRAAGILRETRTAAGSPVLQVLGLRSAFELSVVGRYFVAHRNGSGEFRRDTTGVSPTTPSLRQPPTVHSRRLLTSSASYLLRIPSSRER